MAAWTVPGFGGLPLVVESWGESDAPAVVLVHGFGQSRGIWRRAAHALAAAGRHVLAFDLRGHGESGRATDGRYDLDAYIGDLRSVLDSLPDRPVVVGASAAGWIAAAAIGEGSAQLASGLVLIDAAPWQDVAATRRLSGLLQLHAAGFATVEAAYAATVQLHPLRPPPSLDSLRARLITGDDGLLHWRWDPRVFGSFRTEEVVDRLRSALLRAKTPTLCVRGSESDVTSVAAVEQLLSLIPWAESVEVVGAGHLVVNDQADSFNAVLLEFLERRIPRAPLEYTRGSDPRTLRDALGCFATGITVVTATAPNGSYVGLTANSFTSVSLEPPLILACIAKSAGSLSTIEAGDRFAINVLHIGQQPVSECFARRGGDRFAATAHETWESGVPILCGSLASFECHKHALHDGGDHVILVGRVERAQFEPRRDPLLYFRGKYRRLHFD
jgi:flavin reductase (DIM6/NTAB) family NADH-FMN oxidoreductase RutF/pimeloyl-ACP methyl ester carboxylesterase